MSTARTFLLPDLGEGLTEATLVQWLVAVGDTITHDQAIAEVETAKSVVELPSPFAGTVTAVHAAAGETIRVGAAVLEVTPDAPPPPAAASAPKVPAEAPEGEKEGASGAAAPDAFATHREEERAGSGNVLVGYGTRATEGPRRRRRTAFRSEVSAPPQGEQVPVRSPQVRALAHDLGVDLRTVTASSDDGVITRADVLQSAVNDSGDHESAHGDATGSGGSIRMPDSPPGVAPRPAPDAPEDHSETIDGLPVRARERFTPVRAAIAARLQRSRHEIPEATVWVDVDATALCRVRDDLAERTGPVPSLTAFFARFALLALEEFPLLAARVDRDNNEIVTFNGVNLGVAVDSPRGLFVPVIRDAHRLSLDDLHRALLDTATATREGSLSATQMRGSTFTLNNYGNLGVDGSAAIINFPDVAILGVGRVMERAWVIDGHIVPRRITQLSLVFDHRVCDGGYAAGFLRRLTEYVEHPVTAYGRL